MTDLSSIASGGLVRFQPKTGLTGFAGFMNANRIPGFSANGDYIGLPINSTGNLTYVNNAGSTVFTKAHTDLNAAVDNWCGFYFDGSTYIWAVGVDAGTTPDTFYTAKIDVAGTVTAVGNAQPTTDFSATPDWDGSGTNLWYDGSTNFKLFKDSEVMSIAASNGSIAVDTAEAVSTETALSWVYQTSDGLLITRIDTDGQSEDPATFNVVNSSGQVGSVACPPGLNMLGGVLNTQLVPIQHGSDVWLVRGTTTNVTRGARCFTATQFDNAIKRLARQVGVT